MHSFEQVKDAYMVRPNEQPFADMTLATFVEKYALADSVSAIRPNTVYWERIDSRGFIKLRSTPHGVRGTPWIAPDATNPHHYCFAENFLHKTWRSLSDLQQTDDECLSSFDCEQEKTLASELRDEASLVLSRQKKIDI